MRPVALYTIFRCTNYGAILQAYALARILRGMLGEDAVDVLNHLMDPRDNHLLGKITNPATPWFQRWRNRRKFAARYVRPDLFEARRGKTVHLIETEIKPTPHLYRTPEELRCLPPYGTVVVGSDQVWNPGLNHDFGRNPYLADTLPDAQDRVAYAASFGVSTLPEPCRAEYANALGRFRRITVREESGAALCEGLTGRRPEVVLDPTLLLTADDWRDAVGQIDSGGFLAAYWVRSVEQPDVAALESLSHAMELPVRLMSAGPLPKLTFPACIEPCIDADPFDFVRIMSSSSAVVTDSFHGLQFATLFRKPFLAVGNLYDSGSNASRLTDFCARYGLSGGVQDIAEFRAQPSPRLATVDAFAASAFDADRARSLETLKGLLP